MNNKHLSRITDQREQTRQQNAPIPNTDPKQHTDPASLLGKIVAAIGGKCDDCCGHECVKVYAPGIGHLCLANDPMRWRDIKDRNDGKLETGTYLVHQLWPNLHRFVFVAHYDATSDQWRPWSDIDVDGMPLNVTQRKRITHIMPLGVPVIETRL